MGRPPGNAHGEIVAIDTAAALAAPGVVAVWTSRDTADHPPIGLRGGIGTQQADVFRLTPYPQPALARTRCAMSESRLMHSRS